MLLSFLCDLIKFVQGTAARLQHSNGLFHRIANNVEFRRCRYDVDPLARSVEAAASLFDICGCTDGIGVHQVLTGMDHLGCAGCYINLG